MSVKRGGEAAGRTRNRSYALGDPFAHVPTVDRSQEPPLQSAVTPQESPGVLPPTHVPPSTSEMKPRPCPISWRTTLTKSVSKRPDPGGLSGGLASVPSYQSTAPGRVASAAPL